MSREGEIYSQSVKNAVDAGRKIEAIKIYRDENGVGLKEAKHAIDRLARQRGSNSGAGNSDMRESGSGVVSLIKLVVLIAVFAVVYKLLAS